MRTQQDWLLNFYSDRMYAVETTGSVDELGYFALTLVGDEAEQQATLLDFEWPVDDIEDGQFLEPGWYVVETDSQGFIDGTRYDSREVARDVWTGIEIAYENFDAQNHAAVHYFLKMDKVSIAWCGTNIVPRTMTGDPQLVTCQDCRRRLFTVGEWV